MTDLNDRNIADAGAGANERSPQSSRSRTPLASPMPSRSRARSEASDSGNSGVGGRAVGSAVTHDGHSTPQRPESRAEDETLNELQTPSRRLPRPHTSMDGRKAQPQIHRYAKHELVYNSSYRSTPKVGFSRAARDISKPAPKRSPRKTTHYADAWKEGDVPRKPVQGGKFGKNPRNHFSELRETYPSRGMQSIRYGRESPGPFAVDPNAVWDRTFDGSTGKTFNAFKGRTTFGTGPMCNQLRTSHEGPGPASGAMPRQRKLGGGRFNRNKSLSFFDRTIRAAKDLPGPASHNIQMDNRVSGGRFNLSRPKTFVEEEIYRVKDLPSAADTTTSRPWGFTGHYRTTGGHVMPRGGRVMHQPATVGRQKIGLGGQTLVRSLVAEALDNTPGPGYYSVDF